MTFYVWLNLLRVMLTLILLYQLLRKPSFFGFQDNMLLCFLYFSSCSFSQTWGEGAVSEAFALAAKSQEVPKPQSSRQISNATFFKSQNKCNKVHDEHNINILGKGRIRWG